LKIVAIAGFVIAGMVFIKAPQLAWYPVMDRPLGLGAVSEIGSAMTPVLFAFAGWQTANFIAGELKRPERDLPRGLVLGVIGVIVLYVTMNYVYVRALGPSGLAANHTPASAVMQMALGNSGARMIAVVIAISALGFLSQSILTAPRVYFA